MPAYAPLSTGQTGQTGQRVDKQALAPPLTSHTELYPLQTISEKPSSGDNSSRSARAKFKSVFVCFSDRFSYF